MRKSSKVDRNQPEIVKALRQVGATVQSLCAVRDGVPDLLVAYRGRNYLMEIKDYLQPPSKQRLTPDEKAWHQNWNGPVFIVHTIDEALKAIEI